MKIIDIYTPIWKNRAVGIDVNLFKWHDKIGVRIKYKLTSGKYLYPNLLSITRKKAEEYPKQRVKGGVTLYIIPIVDMKEGKEWA